MRVDRIVFVQQVPVPYSTIRTEYFNAPDWCVTVEGADVILYRPANPQQNIPGIPPFRVVGVGFTIPEPDACEPDPVDRRGPSSSAAADGADGVPVLASEPAGGLPDAAPVEGELVVAASSVARRNRKARLR